MLNAFVCFGLVSKEVLTDSMEMFVTGREAGKVICPPILCLCRDGIPAKSLPGQETADQGEVERLVQYVKENFVPGLTFTDLENLNQQALLRCKTVDSKPHGTTSKVSLQACPLPVQETQDCCRRDVP